MIIIASVGAEEAVEGKPDPLARLLGGGKKAAREAGSAAKQAQQGTRKAAGRAKAAALATGVKPATKRGGFLQSLGIGQETFYPEDD